MCRSTERPLYFPIINWINSDGEVIEESFQSESEGFFQIEVPNYVDTIYVRNKGYHSESFQLMKTGKTSIIVKLVKNTTYG